MGKIYSDLEGEILTTESKEQMLYLYDRNGGRYNPNLLAMKRLRDYLNAIVQKHPEYFKRAGEPLEKRVVKK